MAGRSFSKDNFIAASATEQLKASGKNRDQYTSASLPGLGAYASGGVVVADNGYIYHVFLSTGAFTVLQPSAYLDSVEYMVVAGGGAGGTGLAVTNGTGGGGGGAGGVRLGSVGVTTSPYPVVVGAAGGGVSADGTTASSVRSGSTSSVFGVTASGGGGGGSYDPPPFNASITQGAAGGSGGGSAGPLPGIGFAGGAGNNPPSIPRQGNPGGEAAPSSFGGGTANGQAGGGGGYWSKAGNVNTTVSSLPAGPPFQPWGAAGKGFISDSFPVDAIGKAIPAGEYPTWYPVISVNGFAAGGHGASHTPGSPANTIPVRPNAGRTYASGYGGHGRNTPTIGSNGGSGIVVIRYKMKTNPTARATGGTIEPSTDPNHLGVFRHIFTATDTFTVTDPGLTEIEYLLVAGGGAGGRNVNGLGGGGGAGGFVSSGNYFPRGAPLEFLTEDPAKPGHSLAIPKSYPVSTGDYAVVIGAGAAGSQPPEPGVGATGSNTSLGSPGPLQIVAYGGGGGGGADTTSPFASYPGSPGGSGGGGAQHQTSNVTGFPGTATVPWTPLTLVQGSNGYGASAPTSFAATGGGGGAAANGERSVGPYHVPGYPLAGGAGGAGWFSLLAPPTYGTPGPIANRRYFAGGGGGSSCPGNAPAAGPGPGGAGGGGNGFPNPVPSGAANTGGGGGAAGSGLGGSGIVIIQYPE